MPDNAPIQERGSAFPRETCLICHEESLLPELVAFGCSHIYHPECVAHWWGMSTPKTCPYCKQTTRSYGHACGQPGACTSSSLPHWADSLPSGPLPVCLPCNICSQVNDLLDTLPDRERKSSQLIEAICKNQTSLRVLLDPNDGTDLSDYDQWQMLDRKEEADKGTFYYCQRDRPSPTHKVIIAQRASGRRMTVYRERPEPEEEKEDDDDKETTTAPIYQHHLRQGERITRAELAYACDMDDITHLAVAVSGRRDGTTYKQWHEGELRSLRWRQKEMRGCGEQPILKAPKLYFDWLMAFERLWHRTRAMDLAWETEMAEGRQPHKTSEERAADAEEIRRELADLEVEYSQRVACLVRVRDHIAADAKSQKRGEEVQQPM
ncbi:hypothetical protein PG993_002048 [Apiospora rasikravindrae]|uniref:RING-type domain-containing protein n=1 Tax=Apiospora rasikravindrae TaxID=990691 RepID=A0ABR1UD48_9PEZI